MRSSTNVSDPPLALAPVPFPATPAHRFVQIVTPTCVAFPMHQLGNNSIPPSIPMAMGDAYRWPHSHVSLTKLGLAAFTQNPHRLVSDAAHPLKTHDRHVLGNGLFDTLPNNMRTLYTHFSSDRAKPLISRSLSAPDTTCGFLKAQGNLMSNASALDPHFSFDYSAKPHGVCLRLSHMTGRMHVERPVNMRMLVGERVSEQNSWSVHRAYAIPPVMTVATRVVGLASRSDMVLDSFSEPAIFRYSTHRSEPKKTEDDALEVGHHVSAQGEMDVEMCGNMAYDLDMYAMSAVIYIQFGSATRVAFTDLVGRTFESFIEYMGDDGYLAMNPSEALSSSSGIEAMARHLGVGMSRAVVRNKIEARARYEMQSFEALDNLEQRERAEALAQHITMDTDNGLIFFRDTPLVLRTHDNVYYTAFISCDDARNRLPLCYFVRISTDELKRLRSPAPCPFRMHALMKSGPSNAIVRKCLDADTIPLAMARLSMYFGSPVYCYKTKVDSTENSANAVDYLNSMGAEITMSSISAFAAVTVSVGDTVLSHVPIQPQPPSLSPSPSSVPIISETEHEYMNVDSPELAAIEICGDAGHVTIEEIVVETGDIPAPISLLDTMSSVIYDNSTKVSTVSDTHEQEATAIEPASELIPLIQPVAVSNPPSSPPPTPKLASVSIPSVRKGVLSEPLPLNDIIQMLSNRLNVVMTAQQMASMKTTSIPLPIRTRVAPPLTSTAPLMVLDTTPILISDENNTKKLALINASHTPPPTHRPQVHHNKKRMRSQSMETRNTKRARSNSTSQHQSPPSAVSGPNLFSLPPPPRLIVPLSPPHQQMTFFNTFDTAITDAMEYAMGNKTTTLPFSTEKHTDNSLIDVLKSPNQHEAIDFLWDGRESKAHAAFESAPNQYGFDIMDFEDAYGLERNNHINNNANNWDNDNNDFM